MKEPLTLEKAIESTITYFDIFDFPLNLEELTCRLYGWSAPSEAVAAAVSNMPQIGRKDGLFYLKNREFLVGLRKEKDHQSALLWKKAKRFAPLFALCPFVRMTAVCNSLSYGNVSKDSDIDLFVVAKNNRLSLARFFMKILTQLFGARVHHDKIAGRFCLSFFVTQDAMCLEKLADPFDPHLAYFTAYLTPITGSDCYKDFLLKNEEWTVRYFKKPLPINEAKLQSHKICEFIGAIMEFFIEIFGDIFEKLAHDYQNKKDSARKKKFPNSKGIVMNRHVFKFHENDTREEIAGEFEARISRSIPG